MNKQKINLITLGCSKNVVDSELLLAQLNKNGYSTETNVENSDANISIINTCGFIGDAKEESIDTILEQVRLKKDGVIEKIIVVGCLSQRYNEELTKELPEVDAFFGKFEWKGVLNFLGKKFYDEIKNTRSITTHKHIAFLKISEGCDRKCSYCAIPLITGKHKSRAMEDVLEECHNLAEKGVKEVIVIAQDSTYYGLDIYGENKLAELLDRIADINEFKRIRLHYAYPAQFPTNILSVIRERDNICKYIDIALQHSSDNMLKMMKRGIDSKQTADLLSKIRQEVPGICIRTTLMTGHPGEQESDFENLCDFVKSQKFDRLGVFTYSHEEDTHSGIFYEDKIPQEVKEERARIIMDIQSSISSDKNAQKLGTDIEVIIDRKEDNSYIGRTEFDSYEVDGEVYISANKNLEIGSICLVKITGADNYDLYGRFIKTICN